MSVIYMMDTRGHISFDMAHVLEYFTDGGPRRLILPTRLASPVEESTAARPPNQQRFSLTAGTLH